MRSSELIGYMLPVRYCVQSCTSSEMENVLNLHTIHRQSSKIIRNKLGNAMENFGARLYAAEKLKELLEVTTGSSSSFNLLHKITEKNYRSDLFASPRSQDTSAEGRTHNGILRIVAA